MRKTKLFMMLLLLFCGAAHINATKTFANFGAPASSGTWDSETQTYSWSAGWSNLMPIFTFANGELAEYTSLHLTTSDYVDGPYRVCFMNGGNAVATIAFYSAGEKNLVFSERAETKDIDLSEITAIQFGGASGAGSVKLDPNSVYLVKPLSLQFGEDGKAHISASDLDVTGNVTVDAQTGVVTSTGSGTISVSLPNCDFSAVTRVDVTHSGEDICNTMAINDAVNGNLNTWYGSKYGCDFTSYQSKAGQVNKITWNVNTAGTMTFSDIIITSAIINGTKSFNLPVGASDVKNLWNTITYPQTFAVQGANWGNNGTSTTNFVGDGTDDYVAFVVTEGSTQGLALRVWVTDGTITKTLYAYPYANAASVENWEASYLIKTPGVYVTKITGYKMSGIKADNNWGAAPLTVALAYTCKGAPVACDMNEYTLALTGAGVLTNEAKDILSDADATIIDATGVTGTGVSLVSANPNCIFKANAGVLSNASNVMVDNTIANLALTDGNPFKVPAGASATAASYNRTLTAAYSTVCLPVSFSVDGATIYEFTSIDGNTVTFTEVANTNAGVPYLVKGTGAVTCNGGALADADASGTFKGTYKNVALTSDGEKTYYGFQGGDFVQIGTTGSVNAKPFRAYMETSASSIKAYNVNFGEDTDAISNIVNELNDAKEIYSVNGVRQNGLQKGINIIKMANGATRKIILK